MFGLIRYPSATSSRLKFDENLRQVPSVLCLDAANVAKKKTSTKKKIAKKAPAKKAPAKKAPAKKAQVKKAAEKKD